MIAKPADDPELVTTPTQEAAKHMSATGNIFAPDLAAATPEIRPVDGDPTVAPEPAPAQGPSQVALAEGEPAQDTARDTPPPAPRVVRARKRGWTGVKRPSVRARAPHPRIPVPPRRAVFAALGVVALAVVLLAGSLLGCGASQPATKTPSADPAIAQLRHKLDAIAAREHQLRAQLARERARTAAARRAEARARAQARRARNRPAIAVAPAPAPTPVSAPAPASSPPQAAAPAPSEGTAAASPDLLTP